MSWLKNITRRLPLFGGLADCRLGDHVEAGREFLTNFIFSTLPIWLGGLLILALDRDTEKSVTALIISMTGTVRGGELFMYSTAMVAPIVYMALKPERGMPNFPGQMGHIAFIVIIALISTAFFAVQRAGVWMDEQFVFPLSVVLYVFSLFLLYLAMVYRNYRLTAAPDVVREQTEEFVEEFNRRH